MIFNYLCLFSMKKALKTEFLYSIFIGMVILMPKINNKIYTDGAARGNPGPGSWAFVLVSDDKVLFEDKGTLGHTTNNVAEYNAIINGLKMAKRYGWTDVTVMSDSQLAINQLNGAWRVKKEHLRTLYDKAMDLVAFFDSVKFVHAPRNTSFIERADHLANMALDE